jgi:sulfonate transport system ATP-binding protein
MIRLDRLCLRAGSFALDDVSLTVAPGEYAVLMGKTGCGKSTLLETVAGLKPAHSGRVFLHERDVTSLRPSERGAGYMPQDLALFPTLTVREHLAFALVVRDWPRKLVNERIDELAGTLGIAAILDRYPQGLSGGESQRVALARALVRTPDLLLLDEPFGALDALTRLNAQALVADLWAEHRPAVLLVTHDVEEALLLADRALLLAGGRIEREYAVDLPRPRSLDDPRFIALRRDLLDGLGVRAVATAKEAS